MESFRQWRDHNQRTKRYLIILAIAFISFILVIEISIWSSLKIFFWPATNIVIILYFLVIVYEKFPFLRNPAINAEGRLKRLIRFGLYLIVALPFTIYSLKTLSFDESINPKYQLTLVSSSSALAGFIISLLGSKIALNNNIKNEFISSTQKFALCIILFLVFIPSIQLVDTWGPININKIAFDIASIGRGLYFWFSATCFYSSMFLFSLAIVDFGIALRGLRRIT
jgi:hypothetical protein